METDDLWLQEDAEEARTEEACPPASEESPACADPGLDRAAAHCDAQRGPVGPARPGRPVTRDILSSLPPVAEQYKPPYGQGNQDCNLRRVSLS